MGLVEIKTVEEIKYIHQDSIYGNRKNDTNASGIRCQYRGN